MTPLSKFIFAFTIFLHVAGRATSQVFTLEGTAKDSASAEALPYANIQLLETRYSTQSNAYGFFSIKAPAGRYRLQVSYLGYKSEVITVSLTADRQMNIKLAPFSQTLNEIEIKGDNTTQEVIAGRNKLNIANVQKQTSFAGEPDLLKAFQFLPGVKSPSEATTNLSVRGGSYDQTLILLDGAPVYNSSHALGFFSTFNPDAIKDA